MAPWVPWWVRDRQKKHTVCVWSLIEIKERENEKQSETGVVVVREEEREWRGPVCLSGK